MSRAEVFLQKHVRERRILENNGPGISSLAVELIPAYCGKINFVVSVGNYFSIDALRMTHSPWENFYIRAFIWYLRYMKHFKFYQRRMFLQAFEHLRQQSFSRQH